MTDWNKVKVVDLKAELKKRGLLQTGLKPALVARLTAAEIEDGTESEATVQGDLRKLDASTATSPDTVSSTQHATAETVPESVPQPTLEPVPNPSEQPAAPESEDINAPMTDAQDEPLGTQSVNTSEFSRTTSQPEPERSALPSVEPQEVIEDRQKRKRRSQSPPISSADAARKRARKSEEFEELTSTPGDSAWVDKSNVVDEAGFKATSGASVDIVKEDNQEEDGTEGAKDDDKMEYTRSPIHDRPDQKEVVTSLEGGRASEGPEGSPSRTRDSRFKDLFDSPRSGPAMSGRMEEPESRDSAFNELEPERNISPAIHPATAALYIRDFMRPLNPAQLKAYLADLATPPNRDVDADIVTDFYLDPIRTHALVSFTNVSAASRVRSALHGGIWPDERTRKPLWVDFVPSDVVREWIEVEESSNGAGRGSGKKWEVCYDVDDDRRVTASLQEASSAPIPQRKPSAQMKPQAMPFQPPTPLAGRGIEGAPSGPRAEQVREPSRGQGVATNTTTLDQLFRSTTAKPVLYWLPVSKEVADKRLDALDDAASKNYSRRGRADGDINRFTFQDGHVLVDRGPELFGGIRPPPGFRGPQFGTSGPPRMRGGFGGGGRGDRIYDSYRGGGGGTVDRRAFRDERDDWGGRGFRDDRRY